MCKIEFPSKKKNQNREKNKYLNDNTQEPFPKTRKGLWKGFYGWKN